MAYRPSWKGHLKVSLVSCPVALYNVTTQARMVSFHLLNPKTMNRIQMRPYDPESGEVERQTLVHGYEVEKGRYVTVEEDELKNVRLPSTKTIDIEKFVDRDAIDPVYVDGPYYLAPDKGGEEAFSVIREAMRTHGKAALGRLVMSHRERTVAITPRGKGMLVEVLRHPQEIRDDAEIFDAIPSAKPDKGMVDIAARIIGQTSGQFEPDEFEDRYETALRELIDARAKGRTVAVPEPLHDTKVVDLMAALKASLGRRGPPPAGGGTVVRLPTRGAGRQKPRRSSKPRHARG
jgi:DNA end-binding protein Ku